MSSEQGVVLHGETASEPFLSAAHQILCGSDGRIITTNTGRNTVVAFHPDDSTTRQSVRVPASTTGWDYMGGSHLNSVYERDGKLYVLASASKLLVTLTYPEMKTIESRALPIGLMHNVWVADSGEIVLCNSPDASVYDLAAERTIWRSGDGGWTRGLAATAEHVVIGSSGRSARAGRTTDRSGIFVVDRATWQTLDYVSLGPMGAIYDLRLVDVADQAHHGSVLVGHEQLHHYALDRGERHRKLEGAQNAHQALKSDFRVIFGGLNFLAGERIGSDALAAISVFPGSAAAIAQCGYDLSGSVGEAHVSAVLARPGSQQDSHMDAALIHVNSAGVGVLQFWRQDGRKWAPAADAITEGIPASGRLELRRDWAGIQILIDGVLRAQRDRADLQYPDGELGFRWVGPPIQQPTGFAAARPTID